MTRLEKVLSIRTDLSKIELIFCLCPHDFGVEDDSNTHKNGWECKEFSGCEKCWNREVDDE